LPSGLVPLRPIFLEAREELAKSAVSDEALERLEADLEKILAARSGAEERAAAQREILAEHKSLRGAALAAAVDLKLVKRFRDRHRIPYLSPFYY
jgi:multidrug resistance efflux pump